MNPKIKLIDRILTSIIKKNLNSGKVLVLYGSRQVGKTTLLKHLFPIGNFLYLSCDQSRIKDQLVPDLLVLKQTIGEYKNVILDEAQYLDNAGLTLKILIDNFPERNFLASGSSSFELANKLSEPLTGRFLRFFLTPLVVSEIRKLREPQDVGYCITESLTYGLYPEIFNYANNEEKISRLMTLTDAYLYRDILTFNLVKNSRKVRELLVAVALQLGSEVSYSELAVTVGVDRKTVEYYLDLLEKSFVIFRLYGFSRNLRSEINRKVKIYFYDLGVRNAIINNFNDLSLRSDKGGIFENFVISEMIKKTANDAQKTNYYFWKTYSGAEVDLISEKNGVITAFEIKYDRARTARGLKEFIDSYKGSLTKIVVMNNLPNYL